MKLMLFFLISCFLMNPVYSKKSVKNKNPFKNIDSAEMAKKQLKQIYKIPKSKKDKVLHYLKDGNFFQKWSALKYFKKKNIKPPVNILINMYKAGEEHLKKLLLKAGPMFYKKQFLYNLVLIRDTYLFAHIDNYKQNKDTVKNLFLMHFGSKETVLFMRYMRTINVSDKSICAHSYCTKLSDKIYNKKYGVYALELLFNWHKTEIIKKSIIKNIRNIKRISSIVENLFLLKPAHDNIMKLASTLTKVKDNKVLYQVLELIGQTVQKNDKLNFIMPLLRSKSSNIVEKSMFLCVKAHYIPSIKPIVSVLQKKDLFLKALAARALGELNDGTVEFKLIDELRQLSQHHSKQNFEARKNILLALGKIGGANIVPVIIEALGIKDQRKIAIKLAAKYGSQAIPFLIFILKTNDKSKESAAVEALINIGKPASARLVRLLNNPSKQIREKAISLLTIIGDSQNAETIYALMKKEKGISEIELLRTVRIFYYSLRPLFLDMLKEGEIKSRSIALKTILNMKDFKALPLVAQVVENDRVPEIRQLALRVLWFLNYEKIEKIILKIIQFETDEIKKEAVLGARFVLKPNDLPAIAKLLKGETKDIEKETLKTVHKITGNFNIKSLGQVEDWVSAYNDEPSKKSDKPDKSGFVNLDKNRKIYYEIYGTSGPFIVVVPGGPEMGSQYLKKYLSSLKDDYRVVFFDPSGRGNSKDLNNMKDFSVQRDADDIEILLKQLKINKAFFLGHGYGGLVVIKLFAKYPEIFKKIIFSNIPVPEWSAIQKTLSSIPEKLTRVYREDYEFLMLNKDKMKKELFLRSLNATILSAYFKNKAWIPFFLKYKMDAEKRSMLVKKLRGLNLRSQFKKINVPAYILISKYDIYSQENIEWLFNISKKQSNFKLKGFSESGHFPFIEENKTYIETIKKFFKN